MAIQNQPVQPNKIQTAPVQPVQEMPVQNVQAGSVQQIRQPANPNTIQQPKESILKKWWFWLIIGIIIVGGVALAFFLIPL